MSLNSRSLSFLIALVSGSLTALLLSSVPEINPFQIVMGFIGAFFSAFIISFVVLELFIFRELRKIFGVFSSLKKNRVSSRIAEIPIKEISSELFKYADTKEQEINKLRKLEAFRKEFLADISHELKTPIFSAQGFIDTLRDGAIDDLKVRDKFLKKAAKSLDELDGLVHDLLSISQLETGEFILDLEEFNLELLVKEIYEQIEVKAQKKKVTLTISNKDKKPILVNADRHRIEQVMKNLVVNAINYGYEGGHVEVSFKSLRNEVEISVIDNGPGIPLEHQDKIFRRFYRVDKSRSKEMGGTGLGLSIVKHIVEAHGSKINLQSKVGKGTSFLFKLEKGYGEEN